MKPPSGYVVGVAPGWIYREHPTTHADNPFFTEWDGDLLVRQGSIEGGIFRGWEHPSWMQRPPDKPADQ
jgi:hypothetical protein